MATNNYYRPFNGSFYGKSKLSFGGTGPGRFPNELGQRYWDQQPAGAFTRWLSEKGIPQQTKFGQWSQGQYNDLRNAYSAATGDNPELSFYGPQNSFLNTIDLKKAWLDQSYQQRGENPNLFATRARMLPRGQ